MPPFKSRQSSHSGSFVRVNGKIRAREVRVIASDGSQIGVISLAEAINMARAASLDLVEIASNATPPVCRIVDFGKWRYEQAKKDRESKKNQHTTQVKEVQLSPRIDPHDLGIKVSHAIDFLCEDNKVKLVLKFRGREMAHTEFGFQVIQRFLQEVSLYGHPDFQPKLVGRGITLMVSPLPRNKRAKNPRQDESMAAPRSAINNHKPSANEEIQPPIPRPTPTKSPPATFMNNPFTGVEISASPDPKPPKD